MWPTNLAQVTGALIMAEQCLSPRVEGRETCISREPTSGERALL